MSTFGKDESRYYHKYRLLVSEVYRVLHEALVLIYIGILSEHYAYQLVSYSYMRSGLSQVLVHNASFRPFMRLVGYRSFNRYSQLVTRLDDLFAA